MARLLSNGCDVSWLWAYPAAVAAAKWCCCCSAAAAAAAATSGGSCWSWRTFRSPTRPVLRLRSRCCRFTASPDEVASKSKEENQQLGNISQTRKKQSVFESLIFNCLKKINEAWGSPVWDFGGGSWPWNWNWTEFCCLYLSVQYSINKIVVSNLAYIAVYNRQSRAIKPVWKWERLNL